MPEHITADMVKDELAANKRNPNLHPDIPKSQSEVKTMISRIRETGVSCCRGSFLPNFTTISAPVFDQLGGMIAGLTVMGTVDELTGDLDSEPVRLLKASSAKISSAAGWES